VVKNRPGAGHIIGANLVYNAKPNGLTLGNYTTGLAYSQLINTKGIRFDLAKMSFMPMGWPGELGIGLEATGTFTPTSAGNFPNGCHVCEVEIDPDTGAVEIVRYTGVDDSGVIINPLLFAGQIHGGIAQGIGQALYENMVYDETGQLQSGSFLDYCMPRADDMPSFTLGDLEVPCPTNPLGVKGAGESGTVPAMPVIIHAILNALGPHGVTHIDMPATPEKVWKLIAKAITAAI